MTTKDTMTSKEIYHKILQLPKGMNNEEFNNILDKQWLSKEFVMKTIDELHLNNRSRRNIIKQLKQKLNEGGSQ